MARQSNEDPAVPEGSRKGAPTRDVEPSGRGKGISVNQQAKQLDLFSETAEDPGARAPRGRRRPGCDTLVASGSFAVPKSENKIGQATSATMEEVAAQLRAAFKKVASNKGAPGPDGQSIEEVRKHLPALLPEVAERLLSGSYQAGEIRRVWIPKASGGERGLGIPTVVDRMVQEAVRRVLEPQYEPLFHRSSHGFRPGKSCHTAITEARSYVDDGHAWVVDIDLKNFFDQVCHQRLMARLAERIEDKRLLVLIGRWLKAKLVMPDGLKVSRDEGVPQGGPLSPLLSNIVLDELDSELARRGHRFVRYADDCNVYVRSERAGQRVMASLTRFITKRLRLEMNAEKSAVARTEERHFVGFCLRVDPLDGCVEVGLSKRSRERIDARIRELTPRNWGGSLKSCISKLNVYLVGWVGFFGICTGQAERTFATLDAHIRRRLRAIQLKHWKRRRTMVRKLIQLGVRRKAAWRSIYGGRRSIWKLSHSFAADRGLRNAYFADRGLVSLAERLRAKPKQIEAPAQLTLALG